MAISSPYACIGKEEVYKSGPLRISLGGGFNYGIFNPGGGTAISIASRLGYLGYVEGFRNFGDSQKLIIKIGYVAYNGKSSVKDTNTGKVYAGDVTSAGYFLQAGVAYQL